MNYQQEEYNNGKGSKRLSGKARRQHAAFRRQRQNRRA